MPTKYQGKEKEVRALDAFINLMRAAESVSARIAINHSSERLTVSQFGVLEALLHGGPLCQRDIAKKILKSSGNITMVIDNLEKNGFVSREPVAGDRRFYAIHLTPKGRKLITRIFPAHVASIVTSMNALTAVEQDELGRLCRKLGLGGSKER